MTQPHNKRLRLIFGLITIQCVLSASILITNFESLTPHPFNIYLKSIPYLAAYLPAIFFAYAFVLSVLYPSNTGQVNQFLGKLSQKTTLLIGFLIVTINGLAATYLYVFPSGVYLEKNSPLLDIYQAIFFPTIIFILISSELLIYIININKPDWKTLVADKDYRRLGITFLILFFTFLYWELLLLQTRKISYLPHWLSPIATRPITNHFLFIIPFTLLIIFVVKHAHLEKTLSSSKKLLLLLFFGLAAQFFFGFLSGEGLKSIQRFYFEQPISTSALYGCQHSNILDLIRNYDQYRGQDFFTKTKPPGFLTLHVIFAKLVKSITGVHDNQTCKLLYSQYGSVIFPFISALSLIPITYISKKVFKLESPYLPGILYSLMPNYMLCLGEQLLIPIHFVNVLRAHIHTQCINFKGQSCDLGFQRIFHPQPSFPHPHHGLSIMGLQIGLDFFHPGHNYGIFLILPGENHLFNPLMGHFGLLWAGLHSGWLP